MNIITNTYIMPTVGQALFQGLFTYWNSFNPHNSLIRYMLFISPFWDQETEIQGVT